MKEILFDFDFNDRTFDHTIFGTTKNYYISGNTNIWDAWTSIKEINPFTDVPRGCYVPQFFGFDLPEVRSIFVGKCAHGLSWSGDTVGHVCDVKPDVICIRYGTYVLSDFEKPSDAVLHEYAHVLAGPDTGHGDIWAKFMKKLGLAPSLSVDPVFGAPMHTFDDLYPRTLLDKFLSYMGK